MTISQFSFYCSLAQFITKSWQNVMGTVSRQRNEALSFMLFLLSNEKLGRVYSICMKSYIKQDARRRIDDHPKNGILFSYTYR